MSPSRLQRRFERAAVIILVVGILAVAWAARRADGSDGGAIGYEVVNGQRYAVMPGENKADIDQVERIGGQSAETAVEFNTWFASLWQGRRLAYTLAVLTIGSSLACFLLAHLNARLPPEED